MTADCPAESTAATTPPPSIDPTRLAALLGPLACRFDVDALAVCDSTNSVLLGRATAASGSVVVADRQTAGRGRRGRTWQSEATAGLTFSLLWRFPGPPATLAGLSLAVGVAVARGLAAAGHADVMLKWPNDLLRPVGADWGKLGGVLVEMGADGGGSAAVIGIGINLLTPALPLATPLPAVGLVEGSGGESERHAVLAAVLVQLAVALDRFAMAGLPPFVDEWQARHAFAGRLVRLEENGRRLGEGRCLGIDADGALRVEVDGRPQRWLNGDLSLRPA